MFSFDPRAFDVCALFWISVLFVISMESYPTPQKLLVSVGVSRLSHANDLVLIAVFADMCTSRMLSPDNPPISMNPHVLKA